MTRRITLAWCLLLVALIASYWPALQGALVWDDASHITRPSLRSMQGLLAIWTNPRVTQQYYPLTHSAFWVMHRLWGDHTFGYHLANVAIHGVNATLVLVILIRLKIRGALFAAALFMLHPVQVESVAWMTELKNTLSGFFYLTAAIAYFKYLDRRQAKADDAAATETPWLAYFTALALFLLGLLSKTSIATWPAAMLVVTWRRNGRIGWKRDVHPLLPFFIAALAMSALTAHWEINVWGAQGERFELSVAERLIVAGRAVWFYLWSLLWPAHLMFFYPRWIIHSSQWIQYVAPIGVLVALLWAWLLQRRIGRGTLAGLLLYGGTLLPCLGFINLYWQVYTFVCDHMQYLACIGMFALLASIAGSVISRVGRSGAAMKMPLGVAVIIMLALLTRSRASVFVDSETLWKDTIARNPECWMACNNLGIEYERDGRDAEAIGLFRQAIAIKPDHSSAWTNLGMTLIKQKDFDQALDALGQSLKINPNSAETHFHVARACEALGRPAEAIKSYRQAIQMKPDFAFAHGNLGVVLASIGRAADAQMEYELSLKYDPDQVDVLNNLAWLLATTSESSLHNGPRAVALAKRALALSADPAPELLGTLAAAYARAGEFELAIQMSSRAVDIAESRNRSELAALLAERQRLYETHQAYSESPPHP